MRRSAFLVNFYKIPTPFLWVIPIKIAGAVIFRLHSGPEIWYNREEGGGHGPTVPAKNACGTVSRKKRRVYRLRQAADSGCEEPRRRSKSGRQGRSVRTDRLPGFRPQLSRRKTVGSFRRDESGPGITPLFYSGKKEAHCTPPPRGLFQGARKAEPRSPWVKAR